ncbi:hydroxymethylbilane synthase [Botrimarina mediterranea]|uniref:Porphobilinogen deaminase n=1 Tax=Botrimarina mediterranea TaxID=2528022 RepID=A0A518K4G4_9BACT|nr:hydroxymethylbilane synthase [Botrimarina mediterranea]QDV72682.1 Porphobilinogen deaminase [Botrimarina mediterranea]QDV77254.1 Porphobilinogen deaminase [Planctomycetes bacterium K2D]
MIEPSSCRPLRLGTRGSQLARWQADWVADRLRALGQPVEIIEVRTRGDVQQSGPISAIVEGSGVGGQGAFTKELQRALLDGSIDLAVHSLKDLPTTPVDGLKVGAVPQRAPIGDVLVSHLATTIDELPQGARVGTGSFRRRAQLLNRRPDLVIGDLRGNLDTRLRKLDDSEHDAILLAEAGLTRLGWNDRLAGRIPPSELLPAPGQGALGIECRSDDEQTLAALRPLDDFGTHAAIAAERAALARLEGGCLAALGAWGRWDASELRLSVVVLSEDGVERLDAESSFSVSTLADATTLGVTVADELLARGAAALLRDR